MHPTPSSCVTSDAATPLRFGPLIAEAQLDAKQSGFQVEQVLHHVAHLSTRSGTHEALGPLVEAADVCGRLVATRRQLFMALNTHNRLERLAHVALGRERARPKATQEHGALQSVEALMQSCVNDVLGQWRRFGQAFTRLTHLLPTQLDHRLRLPVALTTTEHQVLVSRFVRLQDGVSAVQFDAAVDAYMSAHRRCQARIGPALAARERRRRAELDLRGAGGPLGGLALALFEEFLSRHSLLVAEGERAGAHHVIHLFANPPVSLREGDAVARQKEKTRRGGALVE